MVTTVLIILLVALSVQAIPSYILEKRAKKRVLELEAENHKLANHILAGQNERLLLPEDIPPRGEKPAKAPAKEAQKPEDDGLDQLLDLIESTDLTGVESGMSERRKVVIFKFGDLAVRDTPTRTHWNPDIMYHGVWVGVLYEPKASKFRRILSRKLTEAAARGIGQQREDSVDPETSTNRDSG